MKERLTPYRDMFSGRNVFINPKRKRFRFRQLLRLFYRIPALIFLFIFPAAIRIFVTIDYKKQKHGNGVYASNRGSFLDFILLKHIFKNPIFYDLTKEGFYRNLKTKKITAVLPKDAINIVFIEECMGNNLGIVKFVKNIPCDYVIGLLYSGSCVHLYGNKFFYFVHFMLATHDVTVKVVKSNDCKDIARILGLPLTENGIQTKTEMMQELYINEHLYHTRNF